MPPRAVLAALLSCCLSAAASPANAAVESARIAAASKSPLGLTLTGIPDIEFSIQRWPRWGSAEENASSLSALKAARSQVEAFEPGELTQPEAADRTLALTRLARRIEMGQAIANADSLLEPLLLKAKQAEDGDEDAALALPGLVQGLIPEAGKQASLGLIPPGGLIAVHLWRLTTHSPNEPASAALRRLADALELADNAEDPEALGPQTYAWRLRWNFGIPEPPEVIVDRAWRRASILKDRTRKLANAIAPGRDPKAVLDELNRDRPKSDEELLGLYHETVQRAVDFPPARRSFPLNLNPLIRIELAADLPQNAAAAFSVGNNTIRVQPTQAYTPPRSLIATLAAHEGYPGHQHYFAQSWLRIILRSRYYENENVMAVEGYATYVERELARMGFYSPREELSYLAGRLRHCLCAIADMGLHSGALTRPQAQRLLVEEAWVAEDRAAKSVAGMLRKPGFILPYWLGMERLLPIKRRTRAALGPRFCEPRFHEALLSFGPVPLEVVDQNIAARMSALGEAGIH
ncbi:MAG: DUF885 family protein [Elusimicrobia bacterium]|nr:DUF885 family protein [Elusimicrobiota bacterium]MDE2426179.1 DUF885 family protein [Elusimicrobiota bacterium]